MLCYKVNKGGDGERERKRALSLFNYTEMQLLIFVASGERGVSPRQIDFVFFGAGEFNYKFPKSIHLLNGS